MGNLRKLKNPGLLWESVPFIAALIAATSAVGPPMSVVPVSMADRAVLPVEIGTDCESTVISDKWRKKVNIQILRLLMFSGNYSLDIDKSQKDGVLTGILINSTDPLNSEELVPPSVNTPPGTSCV